MVLEEYFLEERVGRIFKNERVFGQESGGLETFVRVWLGHPIISDRTFHDR